jgi:hypothetical protein
MSNVTNDDWNKYLETLKTTDELGLESIEVLWPETKEMLDDVIKVMTERNHDYGTCVYAMSIAALSTHYYMGQQLGVTGFQASAADLDFVKRSRGLKTGLRLIDYEQYLYPQYNTLQEVAEQRREFLRSADAKKYVVEKLAANPEAHPDVLAHWKGILNDSIV